MLEDVNKNGLVLLGCGKMGSALLKGWLAHGINASAVTVLDPRPSDWVQSLGAKGLSMNTPLPKTPAVCVLAVKPQMMQDALVQLTSLGNGSTVFLSIAAGTSIVALQGVLGLDTPIIRAMPNTPSAVGCGITALTGNTKSTDAQMQMAEMLMAAVGQTVHLKNENDMDAVTAVSGSGPAYVFHLIETMAAAGAAEGLAPDLAMTLAKATVAGAGKLAEHAEETPTELRVNVTSPGGTTAAALEVMMHPETGFPKIVHDSIKAAANRSRALKAKT